MGIGIAILIIAAPLILGAFTYWDEEHRDRWARRRELRSEAAFAEDTRRSQRDFDEEYRSTGLLKSERDDITRRKYASR